MIQNSESRKRDKGENERLITVFYYDHDCPWVSKYCEENHTKIAKIPISVVEKFGVNGLKETP